MRIVTVHSPEFAHERDVDLLRENAVQYDLTLPILVDNSRRYFAALKAEGWPSIYLVDRRGYIRYVYLGETHAGYTQARHIEASLAGLLAEEWISARDDHPIQ